MNVIRGLIDRSYNLTKDRVYSMTQDNPEVAHDRFVQAARALRATGLDRILFNNDLNKISLPFELSNAAGFNKNADISPQFLAYVGFNRVVVGTVTGDVWAGNSIPRMVRFPQTRSLVNWMGLPGVGANKVGENLRSCGTSPIPITVNLMGTPGKTGDELLADLEFSMRTTAPYTDRFELNISCPNTHATKTGGLDARGEYQKQLAGMLEVLGKESHHREQYLKVSPDLDLEGVKEILDVTQDYNITGITAANTTTNHLPKFIPDSPGKGGASGRAVKGASRKTQTLFIEESNRRGLDLKLIACGGIDSPDDVKSRLGHGASGIQVYTPLIFKGPKLLTDIRRSYK